MKAKVSRCLIFLVLFSCNNTKESIHEVKEKAYNQLILNLVLSNPDSGRPKWLMEMQEDILRKSSVKDDSLGIILNLHGWVTAGGDFPKKIIYVSHKSGFEYAFPFYDEMYYSEGLNFIEDERLISLLSHKFSFEDHINFIIYQLGWYSEDHVQKIQKFISLITDLLEMRELKELSDNGVIATVGSTIDSIKEDVKSWGFDGHSKCEENYRQNLDRLRLDVEHNKARVFFASEGVFAFWKFRIIRPPGMEYKNGLPTQKAIEVTFENEECYMNLLL